ncbi:MAG: MoaD/ThiS family protein [Nitrospirota bacterium]|nr:MoaD/ThiS family protein [Nitrospirota bacterium]
MKIHLTNPHKDIEVPGPTRVRALLQHLNLTPEAYLVIRGDDLVTEDELLHDSDSVEIRGVISGGWQ